MRAAPHPYAGQTVALLTQHGKEAVLRPVLEPALGVTISRRNVRQAGGLALRT